MIQYYPPIPHQHPCTNHYLLHERFLNQYALCGRDHAGRSITWIRAPKEPHEEATETAVVRAAIMYHTVIHADPISLRGTVLPLLLIRPTNPPNNDDPRTTRSYKKPGKQCPLTSPNSINCWCQLPVTDYYQYIDYDYFGIFQEKSVRRDRIKFVSSEEALNSIPKASAPVFLGGGGYKNTKHQQDIVSWTKERLDRFPVPHI